MPEMLAKWLDVKILANPVQAYLTSLGIFLAALAGAYAARRLIIGQLRALARRTATDFDDLIVEVLSGIRHPELALISFYFATRGLILNPAVDKVTRIALVLVLSVRGILMVQALVDYGLRKYVDQEVSDLTEKSAFHNIEWLVNAALWIGGGLFILDNLGVNVTSLMTGLGIGGVAVALAAQAILGDLFSSFSILMDKPFRVGDFIIIDDLPGTVENIGIKTTRVRSLQGEMLVFSNSDMTRSRIRNFGLMERRRAVFAFGVVYQTPAAKLRRIPELVRGIVSAAGKTALDRVHFKAFGDSSFNFEVVYYVETGDYNIYMDIQQAINLALVDAFAAEGILFAYPTRTVYVEKGTAA